MSFYQNSVQSKYIKVQDKETVLKSEINRIDKEIDHMVYELYGLTEEEIKIIEQA